MQVFLRTPYIINGRYNIFQKCCNGCAYSTGCNRNNLKVLNYNFKATTLINSELNYLYRSHIVPIIPLNFIQHEFKRNFSLSPISYDNEPLKPSSKVEVTVQALKEKSKEKEAVILAETQETKVVVKKSLKQRIVDELVHYYHGFRLLFIDMKISGGLLWRVLNGNSLSRREYRLLMRTVGDMFRLVPFSVFIIVPFMEFLLPFFIKFFPGMLPSTFQTATEKEDKIKQSLKVKLEMAKFLQQTLDDMSLQHTDHKSELAKEFTEWFHKIRISGEYVSNEDILKFSKLFQDEITLDSLARNQLVALCRVLEVQTLGTNNLLRFQLRMKLRSLAADDKMIEKEGVDSLSLWEVQQACRARGMRAYGLTENRLRSQLQDWLDLSLNEKVPPSLLLLSRALMLPETIPTGDKLKATISSLPDTIVTQTKAAIGEQEGKISNKVQLEVIMEEARKIKEERQEMGEELKKKEQKELEQKEILLDKATVLTDETGIEELKKPSVQEESKLEKESLLSKDVEAIENALDELSKDKNVIVEKVEIEELKEQLADYQEDVQDLHNTVATLPKAEIRETKAAKRLFKKVNKMIGKMDHLLAQLESQELKLKTDPEIETSNVKKEELLKIDDIMAAIKQIKNVPDESRLSQIENVLSKIDDDHDGSIKIEDVLKVIEFIGKENVHLSSKQVDELVEILDKEEILEVENKIEKALKKEQESKAVSQEKNDDNTKLGYDKNSNEKFQVGVPPGVIPPPPPINSIDSKKNNNTKQL